jgi:hypothetical protein
METIEIPARRRVKLSDLLIGRPLETRTLAHQVVSKKVGLAVFASDAISSTAYATEEILVVLALLGSMAYLGLSIPIAIAICVLLVIVTISYRQTIFAYPNGGGAYIVARLYPDRRRVYLVGRGPDHLGLSGAAALSGGDGRDDHRRRHDRQLARREGEWRGLLHPYLLLPGHHGPDSRLVATRPQP